VLIGYQLPQTVYFAVLSFLFLRPIISLGSFGIEGVKVCVSISGPFLFLATVWLVSLSYYRGSRLVTQVIRRLAAYDLVSADLSILCRSHVFTRVAVGYDLGDIRRIQILLVQALRTLVAHGFVFYRRR
jgi:hypothetical protein